MPAILKVAMRQREATARQKLNSGESPFALPCTVYFLFNDCTGAQTNCAYTEFFLHRYTDIWKDNVAI